LSHRLLPLGYLLFESLLDLLLINQQLPHISCFGNSLLMIILQILRKLGQLCMLLFKLFQPDVFSADNCVHFRQSILFLEEQII
jgi:hypothetical protein